MLGTHNHAADNGIVEAEGSFQLIDHFLRSFNIHQNVVCFVQFVDRVSQLTAAPVFQTVDLAFCTSDGADEINGHMQMIKGGGAALTREKIIASVAEKFICIADASKQVDILGKFPLPVEVIPMARSAVARQLVKLGGRPEYRQGVVTDNGNVILDVHGMEILDPIAMENAINAIPGVVTVGLFANRGADVALIGTPDGVKTIVK